MRHWFPPNPRGQAQPPILRKQPTQAQVWKAQIKAHPWWLAGVTALAGAVWLRIGRKR